MKRPERPVHDGIGLAVIALAVLALLAGCSPSGLEPEASAACWLNHSGVEECEAGQPMTWRPVDTTGGGDIRLR